MLLGRQFPQRQGRPHNVVGVLLRLDVPLLLEHFVPLVGREAELAGHLVDFVVHLLLR